jgi:magnesium transporter
VAPAPEAPLVEITVLDYNETTLQEKEMQAVDECCVFRDTDTVTWINLEGIRPEVVEKLGEMFRLHPVAVDSILNLDQRPKYEDFDDCILLVLKMLLLNEERQAEIEQVSIVFGPNYAISFQEGTAGDVFDPIRERIRANKGRIRRGGPDYLAYALVDSIVDNYFVVLEHLGERIEFLEEDIAARPEPATLQAIHDLKQEMIFLRKSVWPLREVIGSMEREESPLIKEPTKVYLRDVYEHTIQVIDTVETYRDMLSGMLDIYLSSISYRLNEVMKVLTIIATIFIPLTFVAGVYGMNFRYMPEIGWKWGYPLVWLVMLSAAGVMLYYFRKKKWL